MKNKILILIIPIISFFIFSNNVKAEEIVIGEYKSSSSKTYYLKIDIENKKIKRYLNNDLTREMSYDGYDYIACYNGFVYSCYFSEKPLILKNNPSTNSKTLYYEKNSSYVHYSSKNYSGTCSSDDYCPVENFDTVIIGNYYQVAWNYNLFDYETGEYIERDNLSSYFMPKAVFKKEKENKNTDLDGNEYVSSIDFSISFNIFNDKYKYYYGYESNDITNEITENNKIINVDHNCNLYVKITKDEQVYYYSLTVTGIENNVTSEDVEFSHTGKDGTEKKYNKLLKIPVSKFYDTNTNTWKDYNLTFLSKEMNSVESNFYITLHSNKTSGIDLPLLVSFRENIDDITVEHSTIKDLADSINQDILNGVDVAKSSVDNKCQISNLPIEKDVFNDNSTYYNKIMFYVTQCDFLKNKTLDDIKNDYIYVYYNARIYESKSSLDKKYKDNPGEFTEANDFASFMMKSLNFFITPIQTIFRLITIFFNNLPYKVRYCIFACFVLVLTLAIFRFLL